MRAASLGTRWLGVGLASVLAVVTLGLGVTGRLGLYINPESAWWAVLMAIVVLLGAVASFALPLGAEADHGHDHGGAGSSARDDSSRSARGATRADHDHHSHRASPLGLALTVTGGVVASAVVVATLVLPPATLSADLAMARDTGAPPLFAGADAVSLAATGDTASFGIGEWATVFATATNPEAFDGDTVQLTGFATPTDQGDFTLTRLVISHCVIDAQPAGVPVAGGSSSPDTGQWLQVTGVVRATSDGRLVIDASSVEKIDEPTDPYEY
ncbi:TIGR03943 family protein [Microbacterium sp. BWT-B31]|uniref:TIGR03943 family putative permease subunit n=1 Tax=Microbacterium sp. BWT-B31 TaxID=3232072 RepID=UPI0035291FE0